MQLVFMGPPGAGKGTQAEWLADLLSVPHLSTGEMLRAAIEQQTEIGETAAGYLAAGKLVPDELIIGAVEIRLAQSDCANGFVLDGFPRTLPQATALDEMLDEKGAPLDLVLNLDVDEELLVQRLVARGRSDDKPDVIRQRFEVYRDQSEPLLEYYRKKAILKAIEGDGTREDVRQRIQETVGP